jgi:hypothetical protein
MDDERMTAAARRAARRLARRTGHPYQTCLDTVARDCSRRNWAHFMESPAPIPREEDRRAGALGDSRDAMLRAIGRPVEMREVWSVGDGELPEGWTQGMFMPRLNALSPSLVPKDRSERHMFVDTIAAALIPEGDGYFDVAGRRTLSGFLLLAIEEMGETASIPAVVDLIGDGLRTASEMHEAARVEAAREGRLPDVPDYVAQWIGTIDLLVREKGHDERIQDALVPLISMSRNERSGILGTVDKGLLVFRSHAVRRRTAA